MALKNQARIQGVNLVGKQITYENTGATYVLDIPAGMLVRQVAVVVTTEFAGTSPTVDVGDTDDEDYWVDNTDVTEGTVGVYLGDGGDAAYYTGHYYAAAKQIRVTVGGTNLTAGACHVVAECVECADLF